MLNVSTQERRSHRQKEEEGGLANQGQSVMTYARVYDYVTCLSCRPVGKQLKIVKAEKRY